MSTMKLSLGFIALSASTIAMANNYPTEKIGEYIIECVEVDERNPNALSKCACAIDTIAKNISAHDYDTARLGLSFRNSPLKGQRAAYFRTSSEIERVLKKYRSAQTEAMIACYF